MTALVTPSLVVGNLAYAITAGAFLVRDILWLRILGGVANAAFLLQNFVSPAGPTYAFVAWSLIFLSINLYQIVSLVLERRNVELSGEDRDLQVSVFPNLPHGEFRLLLKAAHRRDAAAGAVLVEQGQESAEIVLIERGSIELERDGRRYDRLLEGHMLGEVAFVANRPFSSRAVAVTDARLVVWERKQLERLFLRRPSIAIGFHAAFIGQLRGEEPPQDLA